MFDELKKQLDYSIETNNIIQAPFSYINCNNIFDENVYKTLLNTFPENHEFGPSTKKNNHALSLKIDDLSRSDNYYSDYTELMKYISSKEFFFKVIKKLDIEDYITRDLNKDISKLTFENADSKSDSKADISLSCRVGINTPNNKISTVRDAHVDATNIFYTGMLYLRDNDDKSEGANFVIYETLKKEIRVGPGRSVNRSKLKKVNEIQYKGNNMIIFRNGKNSIHGVSPRGITKNSRKFIAFNAAYKHPLFNLKSKRSNVYFYYIDKIKSVFSKV